MQTKHEAHLQAFWEEEGGSHGEDVHGRVRRGSKMLEGGVLLPVEVLSKWRGAGTHRRHREEDRGGGRVEHREPRGTPALLVPSAFECELPNTEAVCELTAWRRR